jgi:hypothetical protein
MIGMKGVGYLLNTARETDKSTVLFRLMPSSTDSLTSQAVLSEMKRMITPPACMREQEKIERDFDAHVAVTCAPCPTNFHPSIPLQTLAGEEIVTRLHSQSNNRVQGCDCIFCSPGDYSDKVESEGHMDLTNPSAPVWIPHRMPYKEAACKITHTVSKPFCCRKAAALAGIVGKEGNMAWLDGCEAAKAGMLLEVRFIHEPHFYNVSGTPYSADNAGPLAAERGVCNVIFRIG